MTRGRARDAAAAAAAFAARVAVLLLLLLLLARAASAQSQSPPPRSPAFGSCVDACGSCWYERDDPARVSCCCEPTCADAGDCCDDYAEACEANGDDERGGDGERGVAGVVAETNGDAALFFAPAPGPGASALFAAPIAVDVEDAAADDDTGDDAPVRAPDPPTAAPAPSPSSVAYFVAPAEEE